MCKLRERLGRVLAGRLGRILDHDLQAGIGEVGETRDVLRIAGSDRDLEQVVGEHRGGFHEPRRLQLLHADRIGGGNDVGRRTSLYLRDERAGPRKAVGQVQRRVFADQGLLLVLECLGE